ncbi:DUF6884 domain-containing protein [Streptomyces venezuelae]|uniref:DUF6884 domain-containing protein n=1 Tax=Streptomyces venezuelae TaxID=54571 RepID=UPI00343C8181
MRNLSPTGARILDANVDGMVAGHAAALARLEADRLVVPQRDGSGTHGMTKEGWAALNAWRQAHPERASAPDLATTALKLPAKQHEAIVTAASRPDQRVPGRDDNDVLAAGEAWFRGPTLRAVQAAGYATTFGRHSSLYLTPEGRMYARQRGGVDVRRRRLVICACGHKKQPHPGYNEYGNVNAGYPAGELYTGQFHRSLRLAADALTDKTLTRILSARHGLVDLTRPLLPYDVTIGDEQAVTPERLAEHAVSLGVHDADVIFLGGRDYAELLRQAIPHLYAPLTGGMGEQRGLCKQARDDSTLREAWWTTAAEMHDAQPAA